MAETSGFFDAEQLTDDTYDREYVAEQFANYFKLFIGNGVFASPTNQLQVITGDALHVVVKAGWAFINGYWYHNSEDKIISIVPNASANDRTDSIMARLDKTSRTISVIALMSTTDPVRTDPYYDLQLAKVFIPSGAQSISQAYITDMRTNESVCGFVKGLVDVISSADLFAQFSSLFNTWFDAMKGQLTTDAAGHLQTEIDGLQTVDTKHDTNFASAFDTAKTTYKTGMYCIYNNTLYKFKADKPSTGWDASKVTAVSLTDAITDLRNETTSGAWTAPALQNSWINIGEGYAPVGYWKDINGTVHLRGLIKGGTITDGSSILFTLPPGYRPAYNEIFIIYTANGLARIDVYTSGVVAASSGVSATLTNLGGVTFRADNPIYEDVGTDGTTDVAEHLQTEIDTINDSEATDAEITALY